MATVHLIYPHAPRISAPDIIGVKVGEYLAQRFKVVYHDWDAPYVIRPEPGDVLLGHPHPAPWTCFRRSMRQKGWRRIICMSPFAHADSRYIAFLDQVLCYCDIYLAITGNYWFSTVANSVVAHWRPKMVHLDLAVDPQDFPRVKSRFGPLGERRFVYIGQTFAYKNTKYLSVIAQQMPDTHFAWIGKGRKIVGLTPLGFRDFSAPESRELIASYDFMITVGNSDANPTTILEAMAWGLIPVCTPQSGYVGYPGIINIPLDNVSQAVAILQELQHMGEDRLKELQARNWATIESHFNWTRFCEQVLDAIESNNSPALLPITRMERLRLQWCAWSAPFAPWRRPRFLARSAAAFVHAAIASRAVPS